MVKFTKLDDECNEREYKDTSKLKACSNNCITFQWKNITINTCEELKVSISGQPIEKLIEDKKLKDIGDKIKDEMLKQDDLITEMAEAMKTEEKKQEEEEKEIKKESTELTPEEKEKLKESGLTPLEIESLTEEQKEALKEKGLDEPLFEEEAEILKNGDVPKKGED